jgi:hypothetical protein
MARDFSIEFQNWVQEKKLGAQDLAVLNAWTAADCTPIHKITEKIVSERLSKSSGTQALELGVELLLLGHAIESVCEGHGDTWIANLRAKRFPQMMSRDSEQKDKWLKFPWPKGSQVRWARHGDLSGVEAKFFISHANEIDKIIRALENVKNEMHKG